MYNSHFIIIFLVYNCILILMNIRILICQKHILLVNHFIIIALFYFRLFYASVILKRLKLESAFLTVYWFPLKSIQIAVHLRSLRGLNYFFISVKQFILSFYKLVTKGIFLNKFRCCWRFIGGFQSDWLFLGILNLFNCIR